MPGYGNWCGPNWTARQNKPTSELTDADRNVPAVDRLDQYCKDHDIELHDNPENADEINQRFIEGAKTQGFTGAAFALLVKAFGPSPAPAPEPTMGSKKQRTEQGERRLRTTHGGRTTNTRITLDQVRDRAGMREADINIEGNLANHRQIVPMEQDVYTGTLIL